MTILTLIPLYKRPQITAICMKNLHRFASLVPEWNLKVVCILSPEDTDMKQNERIVKKYGFKAIYYKNLPVADKLNAGIQYVHDHYDFDYLMNFGSDDLIHPAISDLYRPYFDKGIRFFGINSLYFKDMNTGKTIYFNTYNTNGSIGAGRMIHREIINQFVREAMPLCEPGLDCGLDTSSSMSIKRLTKDVDVIIESGEFPFIVDLKTDTNINHFMYLECRERNIKQVSTNFLNQFYEQAF
jgi:hypothetical protein